MGFRETLNWAFFKYVYLLDLKTIFIKYFLCHITLSGTRHSWQCWMTWILLCRTCNINHFLHRFCCLKLFHSCGIFLFIMGSGNVKEKMNHMQCGLFFHLWVCENMKAANWSILDAFWKLDGQWVFLLRKRLKLCWNFTGFLS